MNWNGWIRQGHRWLSIAFTLTVVANFVALGIGAPDTWLVYAPLPPLFLLLFSGLYMFVLPYVVRRQRGRIVGSSRNESERAARRDHVSPGNEGAKHDHK